MSDPFPGDPLVHGSWNSVTGTLLWLGGDRVLERAQNGSGYRLWRYDAGVTGGGDPFPGNPICSGTWRSIDAGHDLVYLGGDRVLDWETGGLSVPYRIWHLDRDATGGDPFPGDPVVSGSWDGTKLRYPPLVYLGGDRVLLHDSNGQYKVFRYDRTVTGHGDPFVGPLTSGRWSTIRDAHRLVPLGGNRVLDYAQHTMNGSASHYRVWRYDPTVTAGDPLPGSPLAEGDWSTIGVGQLLSLGDDRVLEARNTHVGSVPYRIWRYARDSLYVGGLGDSFQLSAGADGTAWAVDDSGRLWRWDSPRWVQPTPTARASQVAVGDAGHVWHVNAAGQLWRWAGGGWQPARDVAVVNVDTGADGETWAVHPRGNLFRFDGTSWAEPSPGARAVQVAVGGAGHVWHRNSAGQMWSWADGGWSRIPGEARHLAVGADGTACHVGRGNLVYRWNGGQWQPLPTETGAAMVAVGDAGTLWYVDLDNHLHRWADGAFQRVADLPT